MSPAVVGRRRSERPAGRRSGRSCRAASYINRNGRPPSTPPPPFPGRRPPSTLPALRATSRPELNRASWPLRASGRRTAPPSSPSSAPPRARLRARRRCAFLQGGPEVGARPRWSEGEGGEGSSTSAAALAWTRPTQGGRQAGRTTAAPGREAALGARGLHAHVGQAWEWEMGGGGDGGCCRGGRTRARRVDDERVSVNGRATPSWPRGAGAHRQKDGREK